jgi:hypothetical protein
MHKNKRATAIRKIRVRLSDFAEPRASIVIQLISSYFPEALGCRELEGSSVEKRVTPILRAGIHEPRESRRRKIAGRLKRSTL